VTASATRPRLLPLRTGPLSFLQEQLWLVERTQPNAALYNELRTLLLRGPLDRRVLERALTALVERHESLRTTIAEDGAAPAQHVWAAAPVTLCGGHDLSGLDADERSGALVRVARALAEREYDLERGPLFRCELVRLGDDEHALLLAVHHVVADGRSMDLLVRDLGRCYAAARRGEAAPMPPIEAQYVDFAVEQRAALEDGRLRDEVAYWARTLGGAPTVLELPADRPRGRRKSTRGRRDRFRLDAGLLEPIARLADASASTPFGVLLAAWAALLYRHTGQDDLVVGTGAPGRPGAAFDETFGLFANMLPIRLRPSGAGTFAELVDAASDAAFDAFDHQHLPFEKIVEAVGPGRDPSHTTLVQVVFTMWDESWAETSLDELGIEYVDVPRLRSRFDLLVEVVTLPGALDLLIEYDAELFDRGTIAALAWQFERVLAAGVAQPELPVATIPLLDPREEAALSEGGLVVLDRDGNVAPPGVVGEVHVADAPDEELPAPAALRRTGRLGRRRFGEPVREEGLCERRIRLGHYTVQLEQLEDALREHPAVADAAVVVDRTVHGLATAAYVELDDDATDAVELRSFLEAELPRYMVPATITPVPAIPRAGAAVDEALLPAVGPSPFAPVGNPHLEAALAAIWREVMEVEEVARDDNFFALGGHSILAARVGQHAGDVLGVEVPLAAVFEFATVAELAAELERRNPGLEEGLARVEGLPEDAFSGLLAAFDDAEPEPLFDTAPATAPLSSAQLQIWMSEQVADGAARDFVAALVYRIRGPLDADGLEYALEEVVARHEALRAAVVLEDDVPLQRIAPGLAISVPREDVPGVPPEDRDEAALQLARREAERPFDLSRPPLLRARLVRFAPEDHAFVLVQQHLITDAVSMEVLTGELGTFYAAYLEGRVDPLPPLRVRYSDYVAGERDWLQSAEAESAERFWREQLDGAPALELEEGRLAGRRSTLASAPCLADVPAATADAVYELARASSATPFMVVTAAYAAVLSRWSGQDDVVIGTTVDNRQLAGLERTVGCCINLVPLRIDCSGDPPFAELVARTRRTTLDAFAHKLLPFGHVVRALGLPLEAERPPLFQVTCDWVDAGQASVALPGCEVDCRYVPMGTYRFELGLSARRSDAGLTLELEYAVDLWDRAVIVERLAAVVALLDSVARDPGRRLGALA
jgi:non-ribosomal peptide synthetase component F